MCVYMQGASLNNGQDGAAQASLLLSPELKEQGWMEREGGGEVSGGKKEMEREGRMEVKGGLLNCCIRPIKINGRALNELVQKAEKKK